MNYSIDGQEWKSYKANGASMVCTLGTEPSDLGFDKLWSLRGLATKGTEMAAYRGPC